MRIVGHKLIARGAPHTGASCQQWPCDTVAGINRVNRRGQILQPEADVRLGGHGHALCECGWTGPHDLTGADRKRSHDEHKARLIQKGRVNLVS